MSNGRFPHYPGSQKEGKILTFPKTSKAEADAEATEVKEIMEETLQRTAIAKKFYEMVDFLEKFTEGFRFPDINLRKRDIEALSDNQLLNHVGNSDKAEWARRPSFFQALAELIRERGIPLLPE